MLKRALLNVLVKNYVQKQARLTLRHGFDQPPCCRRWMHQHLLSRSHNHRGRPSYPCVVWRAREVQITGGIAMAPERPSHTVLREVCFDLTVKRKTPRDPANLFYF